MMSLVLAAALMAAEPTAAEGAQSPAAPATQAAAPTAKTEKAKDPNAMVCRKEAQIGSRMTSRVCRTQAEWDARRTEDRDNLDKSQRNKVLNGG